MKYTASRLNRESGAVSIFLVIFFALLLGVITLSFVGIVIRDANQSTNNDLSRSAYDSAEAGVEDAKRAIALLTNACTNDPSSIECGNYTNYLAATDCSAMKNFASQLHLNQKSAGSNEIQVRSTADTAFDQAYTCVKVNVNTDDYINSESSYQSDLIPLKAPLGATTFDSVNVNWYTHSDGSLTDGSTFDTRTGSLNLPPPDQWDTGTTGGTPSVLRLELISYPTGSSITDGNLAQDVRTIFLYPTNGAQNATVQFPIRDATHASPPASSIVGVGCGGSDEYACQTTVNFNGISSANRTMYLRVTPIYRKTTFQLKLGSGDQFAGVEPMVDSTGKSGDLYRRVQSRVRVQSSVLYPEFAVDVSNSFCKNFSVGSDPMDFVNYCTE